jgi:hypothetical protein
MPSNNQPGFHLSVPGENGTVNLPQQISQQIGNVFEPYNEATSAARVLTHPLQMTNIPGEQSRGINTAPNRGENPNLTTQNIDIKNNDGSIDRGLFRINSNTFNEMSQNPFWRQAMQNKGITSWDNLNDMNKNTEMALLVLKYMNWNNQANTMNENPNYASWYAAPRDLRAR